MVGVWKISFLQAIIIPDSRTFNHFALYLQLTFNKHETKSDVYIGAKPVIKMHKELKGILSVNKQTELYAIHLLNVC